YPKLGERPFLPFGGLAATGLLFWALGWEHPAGFAWPATLVFGIGVSGIFALIPNDTYLQRQVPDNVRGRVFVVRNVIGAIAWMGSLQLVKSLVHQFGVLHSLAGLGIVTLAVAALTAAIFAARLERPTL
ncbi:MAG: hypothetical protein JO317_02330, partial [Verrucomicrobiae bacterium]|nr:hypothetical protein [Verrucomicrobiae bacterium]